MNIPQTAEFSLMCTALSLQEAIVQLTLERKGHYAENKADMIHCTDRQLEILSEARDKLIRLASEERHKEIAALTPLTTQTVRMQ